jgi:hypothetical protein
MLWLSHLLIRHREVESDAISFDATQWAPPQPIPTRTRREAFELARTLAERVALEPASFASLARELSEDPATRDRGGSLGGVEVGQLSAWPEVLDALAAFGDGEVSRPVETEFGFHVFLRRRPPEESMVSGESIVIGYDQAPWLHHFLARWPIPQRSYAEARARAAQVALEARRSPEAFARSVELYSDHEDALRGGDFGAWSTREPTYCPMLIERLQDLKLGEVADPIDTRLGFQIIRRTPLRARRKFAMERIQLRVDPSLPDLNPDSVASVSKQLHDIGETLVHSPTLFAQFQNRLCCTGRDQWVEGRGPVRAEIALRQGEEGTRWEPVALDRTMLALVKGVAPDARASPETIHFGLPDPQKPDLEYFFSVFDAAPVLAQCPEIASQRLGSSSEERARLQALHGATAKSLLQASSADPRQKFAALLNDVRGLLGPERYQVYLQVLQELVRQRLLAPELSAGISHTFGVPLGQ